MGSFENDRLYNPEFTHENRLVPRATVIPALHRGVFYKNRLDSELILDLNGDYKFCYRENDDLPEFFSTDLDDSAWDELSVPSMWQYHGYSQPVYPNVEYPIPFVPPYVGNKNPVGYYRKSFKIRVGGRQILYFGGVDSAFFVYLNGEYVGFSKGSRMHSEFDVTELVRDGENLLCVKVFTYSDGTYLENQDMLLASGIFRDVMLYCLNDIYVWDYFIKTEKNSVLVDVLLGGKNISGASIRVTVDGEVKTVSAERECVLRFEIDEHIEWNAEEPHTYEVNIELLDGDSLLEVHTKKIGFAEYKVEGNRLLLNGRQITLKGTNRHEHDPKNGRAVTVEMIERELKLIKSCNMNAIRCSHYPNNPAFYELATELGIYVMNEADIETHGASVCGDMGYFSKHPRWYSAYYDRVSRMYERDKNETCIAIWTIGNENGDGANIHKCVEYLKTRAVRKPVIHTGDDVRAPQYSEFREVAYFTMQELTGYEPDGEPVMMLEYGHAMGNSPGLMKDTWDYVYHNRHICGGFVWEFKNHGFYSEDSEGEVFYKYGGDFGDVNHWSNFSMDGYCLSDGTPKPSLAECKNILAPTYVSYENGQITLMNTNDFRPLDYVTLKWEICEDYILRKCGEMKLPPVAPYQSVVLDIDTNIERPVAGAEYFANLRFYGSDGEEIAFKQVSLGVKIQKSPFVFSPCDMRVEESDGGLTLVGDGVCVKFKNGLLSYLEKDGCVLLREPMRFNLYRAPIDNDGIVNWHERWIAKWNHRLYPYFEFILLSSKLEFLDNGAVCVRASGKWTPISKFVGFDVDITYTVTRNANVFVDIHAKPYGKFEENVPRLGVVFPLEREFCEVLWYGRGEDECYCDRYEHCNFGLYRKNVANMNFIYDIPQECGTRIDTRFLSVGAPSGRFSVVASDKFAFSYHDFSLSDLTAARHRNELKKSEKNYLYVDYEMRGLGSKSCGPEPEEQYDLRPHEFEFAFTLAPNADEKELLSLSRNNFSRKTQRLGPTHVFRPDAGHVNVVECNRE